MDSIAKVMAMELGPSGITVNVVGPGLTLTDATAGQPQEVDEQVAAIPPLRRLGMPDDIAGVVLFLAASLSQTHLTLRRWKSRSGSEFIPTLCLRRQL